MFDTNLTMAVNGLLLILQLLILLSVLRNSRISKDVKRSLLEFMHKSKNTAPVKDNGLVFETNTKIPPKPEPVTVLPKQLPTLQPTMDDENLNEYNAMLTAILEESFTGNTVAQATQNITRVLCAYYKIEYASLFIMSEANKLKMIASTVGTQFHDELSKYVNMEIRSIGNYGAKTKTTEGGVPLGYSTATVRGVNFAVFAPLVINNVTIGAIMLETAHSHTLDNKKFREDLYKKIFRSTASVIQNVINTEDLKKALNHDKLTNIYNRRFIDLTLLEQVDQHTSLNKKFHVALMDIDKFKVFNDTYGHTFGDLVLQVVAAYMKDNVGENAWAARYGGEEFLLFFERSDSDDVFKKVDAIRQGISELALTDGTQTTKVTVSFGIADFPIHGRTPSDIIKNADTALYQSKENGRNKVTVFKG